MKAARTFCIALGLCLPASCAGAYTLCDRPFGSPGELLRDVVRDGAVVAHDDDRVLRMVDRFHDSVWTFHKAGSPIPAIVCQMLRQDAGGAWRMQTELACSISAEACGRLQADYDRQAATIEAMHGVQASGAR